MYINFILVTLEPFRIKQVIIQMILLTGVTLQERVHQILSFVR